MMSEIPRLQTHGAVGEDALYLSRPADEALFSLLLAREYCYVLAPRQIGKSSLKTHTASRLSKSGVTCAQVDLSGLGVATKEGDGISVWYDSFADELGRQLGLVDVLPFLEQHKGLLPPLRLERFFREKVLPVFHGGLVIFIDEVDFVYSFPVSFDEFFAKIRHFYNLRANEPIFKKLSFCLLGVAVPADLIRNPDVTPFNIGREVILQDFRREELQLLGDAIHNARGNSSKWLDEIFKWTAGHPYMTLYLCQALIDDITSGISEQNTDKQIGFIIENYVKEMFLNHGRQTDPNLTYAEQRLSRSNRRVDLLSLYRKILTADDVRSIPGDPIQAELILCGLVASREAARQRILRIRNEIFARVFDAKWLQEKEFQGEFHRALKLWMESNRSEALLLRGEPLSAAQSWLPAHRWEVPADGNDFLAASLDLARREAERQRALERSRAQRRLLLGLSIAVGVLAILVLALLWQFRKARTSEQQERIASQTARQLAEQERAARQQAERLAKSERAAKEEAERLAQSERLAKETAEQATHAAALAEEESKQSAERAQGAATRERLARLDVQASVARDKSRQATELVLQPGRQLGALFSGLQAVRNSPKLELGSQWEGLYAAAQTLTPSRILSERKERILTLGASPDGKRIIISDAEMKVAILDAQNGELISNLGHTQGIVYSANFSSDGTRIITAGSDKLARVFRAGDSKPLLALEGHAGPVWAAAFSQNGEQIVTAGEDELAMLWNAHNGRVLARLRGHTGRVRAALFSHDGKFVVTAGADGSVRIWNPGNGRQIKKLDGHTGAVMAVTFSHDGKYLASASSDRTARIWDTRTWQQVLTLAGHSEGVLSIAFSPDGQVIATASLDHTARIWNSKDARQRFLLQGHTDAVWSIAFLNDGKHVITAGTDRSIRSWNIYGQLIPSIAGHKVPLTSASFSPDGRHIVTSANQDHVPIVWDAFDYNPQVYLRGHTGGVLSAHFSPDGGSIITASADHSAILWDARSGHRLQKFTSESANGAPSIIRYAAFSPDGKMVIAGSDRGDIDLWDVQNGKKRGALRIRSENRSAVHVATFSPDGKYILTGSDSGYAYLSKIARISSEYGPDEFRNNYPDTILKNHKAAILWGAFSADSRQAFTLSLDRTVRLWDVENGAEVRRIVGDAGKLLAAGLSPDGKFLATGGEDQAVRLWKVSDGSRLLNLLGSAGTIVSIEFSPDGRRLFTGHVDGSGRIIPLNPEQVVSFGCAILRSLHNHPDIPAKELARICTL